MTGPLWTSRDPIPFSFGIFLVLLGANAAAQVGTGGIEVKLTPLTRRYCHIVRFPRGWEFKAFDKPEDGPINFDPAADYEFRAAGPQMSRFLIGASITVTSGRCRTKNWYSVDLTNPLSRALSVSRETWAAAAVVPLTRRSAFSESTELEQGRAEFNGFRFTKSGAHWFGMPELASRLSPESGWLVLQSWTGDGSSREIPRITIFEDVFDTTRGEKLLTVEGIYAGEAYPRAYLGMAAWLTERYFIVPLGARRERCLVCDFGARNRQQGAKP
jgi:hypothetical protein